MYKTIIKERISKAFISLTVELLNDDDDVVVVDNDDVVLVVDDNLQ